MAGIAQVAAQRPESTHVGVAGGSATLDGLSHLIGALAWPIVVLALLLVYKETLVELVKKLSGRVTKLSIFKVELELAAVESRAPAVVLNAFRDTTQAAVSDSAHTLFEQVRDTTPADYAIVDLGVGDEWITSRLFIAAALLERMRGLKAMVFVGERGATPWCFVTVANPSVVRWSLARRSPWFELAYAQANEEALTSGTPPLSSDPKSYLPTNAVIATDHGGLDGERAKTLTSAFLRRVQEWAAPGAPIPDGWVGLGDYRERATWVTTQLLREMLPASSFDLYMKEMRDEPQQRRARAMLRRRGQFVALVEDDGRFKQLVDRDELLEGAALQLSNEPEQ